MRIMQWLGIGEDRGAVAGPPGLTDIERQLDMLEPAHAKYVVRFAYLLARVARADHDVSPAEAAAMERLVAEKAGLPASHAALVIGIATAHGLRFGGTDDFLVSRDFSRTASRAQKLALLDCLFAVSAVDSSIRTIEDNEIRRIAAELQIGHDDFIAVRRHHAHHLAVRAAPLPRDPS